MLRQRVPYTFLCLLTLPHTLSSVHTGNSGRATHQTHVLRVQIALIRTLSTAELLTAVFEDASIGEKKHVPLLLIFHF